MKDVKRTCSDGEIVYELAMEDFEASNFVDADNVRRNKTKRARAEYIFRVLRFYAMAMKEDFCSNSCHLDRLLDDADAIHFTISLRKAKIVRTEEGA